MLRLEVSDSAFYVRVHRVPTPAETRAVTAELMRRVDGIERLSIAKLDASATLLWAMARTPNPREPHGGGGGHGEGEGALLSPEALLDR